jgi:NAD(P)H-hydrate epimerase
VLGVAVRATVTVTFAGLKLGLLSSTGADHAGRVFVADLGVPPGVGRDLGHAAEIIESRDVHRLLGTRPLVEHKASAGRVVALAGSAGKTGAALLVARGALRAGAGLVTIATFPEAADALERRVVEAMTGRIDAADVESCLTGLLEGIHVVAAGPGFGLDDDARRAVDHVVFGWRGTTVLDADALTQYAGRAGELSRARGALILTPHPGEMARLLGVSARDVERDRFGAVAECVRLTQATVLLKGPRTLVMSPGYLLSCHLEARDAAMCAAHVHGRAAEHWQHTSLCDRGLLAHEIADLVPTAIASLARAAPTLPL